MTCLRAPHEFVQDFVIKITFARSGLTVAWRDDDGDGTIAGRQPGKRDCRYQLYATALVPYAVVCLRATGSCLPELKRMVRATPAETAVEGA